MFLSSRCDLGLETGRHPRRVPADVAGAEHDHPGRPHAGGTAEKDAPTAVVALQEMGTDLHAHAARDLAHGGEQGQGAVGRLHGLVGDPGGAGVDERVGHRRVGGEVEVGEQHQIGPEVAELRRLGLLDLAHQTGALPDLRRGGHDRGARPPVLVVGDARGDARAGLDQHLGPGVQQLADAVRRDGDAVLLGLDLTGHPDGEWLHWTSRSATLRPETTVGPQPGGNVSDRRAGRREGAHRGPRPGAGGEPRPGGQAQRHRSPDHRGRRRRPRPARRRSRPLGRGHHRHRPRCSPPAPTSGRG